MTNKQSNDLNFNHDYEKLEAKYNQAISDYEKLLDRLNELSNINSNTNLQSSIKYIIDDSWKHWIKENLNNGIPPKQLAQTLIEQNYSYDIISQELNIQYTPSPFTIINELNKKSNINKIDVDFPLYVIKNFLNKKQTKALIDLIRGNTGISTIANQKEATTAIRKSNSCYLEDLNEPIVSEVQQKICDFLQIPIQFTEGIQGQFYESGGFYHKHWDASSIDEPNYVESIMSQGNRTWTALINLNVPKSGGETGFFEPDLTFQPDEGQLILWYNLDLETHGLNRSTAHGGKPVIDGEKFIITQWFRQFNRLKP